MADSVSTEDVGSRPPKTTNLDDNLDDKAIVEPKPTSTYARLRGWEPETDEYVRQFLLFHCQFHQTQGFGIEWEKFDYFFNLCCPYDGSPQYSTKQSNQEVINEVTLRAIAKYNQDNGANLVFAEHVSANYAVFSYWEYWITFWARDMSSPCSESKLYQAKIITRGATFKVPIFRVKPTDEEMAPAPVRVKPPYPLNYDIDKPPVVFRFAGPGEDPVPGTPFVFSRDGGEVDIESSSEEDEWI